MISFTGFNDEQRSILGTLNKIGFNVRPFKMTIFISIEISAQELGSK